MTNAERLNEAMSLVFIDGQAELDGALVERMIDMIEPFSSPSLTGVMSGAGTVEQSFDSLERLREIWADWIDVFARVRFVIEELVPVGDNVLMNARQIGTTRHGVDVEQPSAAVWKFRGETLVRVEFHLDRAAAARSAAD